MIDRSIDGDSFAVLLLLLWWRLSLLLVLRGLDVDAEFVLLVTAEVGVAHEVERELVLADFGGGEGADRAL
jgi:hypothetical protein